MLNFIRFYGFLAAVLFSVGCVSLLVFNKTAAAQQENCKQEVSASGWVLKTYQSLSQISSIEEATQATVAEIESAAKAAGVSTLNITGTNFNLFSSLSDFGEGMPSKDGENIRIQVDFTLAPPSALDSFYKQLVQKGMETDLTVSKIQNCIE